MSVTPREYTEQLENTTLSQYAARSANSRGRLYPVEPCTIRTDFIRDRDRIIHCKSFRRMKHKTQVFLSPQGDHYRTRLTHTLEVSQIARTISRALRLNEDLTEAIAMGHDLGHTPFGHTGEDVLNSLLPNGFRHNEQSLRVVDKLENGGQGLNLTYEVRDGIAYINHDIDDAIRAGILTEDSLPKDCIAVLGNSHRKRIDTMIHDVVDKSWNMPKIQMSDSVAFCFNELRSFMFANVYTNRAAKSEEGKAKRVVEELYYYYYKS